MPSQPELGKRLAELRRRRGLSQSDLAGSDLSASYVSLLEAGKREPNPRVLALLAERLHTSVEYLRDGVDPAIQRRVELALSYAELSRRSGEYVEARDRFRLLVDDPDTSLAGRLGEARLGLARSLEAVGDLEGALVHYEELRRSAEREPAEPLWWPGVLGLVKCYALIGDLGHAADLGEAALSFVAERRLPVSAEFVALVSTVAGVHYQRGDINRAARLIEEVSQAAESLGDRVARGAAYWNASVVANAQGRLGEALVLADRALALYSEGDDDRALASLLEIRGWLLLRCEPARPAEALDVLAQAAERLSRAGAPVEVAACETEIARAMLLLGRAADAVQQAASALARLRGGRRLEAGRARTVIAAAQYALGNTEAARLAYESATSDLTACGASREAAAAWIELAAVCEDAGRLEDALAAHRNASTAVGLRGVPATPAASPAPVAAADSWRAVTATVGTAP